MSGLSWEDRLRLRDDVPRLGLAASAGGRPVLEIAREAIAVAAAGLASAGSAHEDHFLDPLRELVLARGISPGEALLERLGTASAIDPARLLDHLTGLEPVA